jgi:benzil reductase ((S)-benzoin forming)
MSQSRTRSASDPGVEARPAAAKARHLYIVTGASRGLGLALVQQLAIPGNALLCLSRSTSPALAALARKSGVTIEQWPADLLHAGGVAARLDSWLHNVQKSDLESVTLINNAGIIGRIGGVDHTTAEDVANVLRVDLEAPVLLTQIFLRATRGWNCARRVLNISSGAGRRAMAGWSIYCAAKAGLDHFTRTVALDEATHANGAKLVSLAPGVIDTDMQGLVRAADASGFPEQQRFLDLKTNQQLASPDDAAKAVLLYLARADFGANPVADVRDA